jgi:hypothetical protein
LGRIGLDQGDIRQPVSVEVAHHRPGRPFPDGIGDLRGEGPVPAVEKDLERGVIGADDDQIEVMIAVEIGGGDSDRRSAGRVGSDLR